MSKTIVALLLATSIATPALAEKGGKGPGHGGGRPEHAGPRHGGGGPAHVARVEPRRQERAQARVERRAAPRFERAAQRIERRAEPRFERERVAREVRREQRRPERVAIRREVRRTDMRIDRIAAVRPAKPHHVTKAYRDAPRNWGQVRSAIAHRDNAIRRWERDRERSVRSIPAYAVRQTYVPAYRTVSYTYPAYRNVYAVPSYQAVSYGAAPYGYNAVPYGYDAPNYDAGQDDGGFDFGSIASAVLPMLLGSSLGDFGVGGLGSGLIGGLNPTYASADPYGYDPYAGGYNYADPYGTAAYEAGYADDALGLGGGGTLGTLASLALGSGILGGGDLLGLGGLGGLGGLAGLGAGRGYADPFGTSPEALLAQSLGGLAV